ncbi:MAG: MFS transporter [Bryobacteraceae bacterium]|jgi:MFS family permease
MAGFIDLLRHNRNYRYTWLGQVVSETGDAFNNIAVFSLALESTGSGLIVSGVMLARAIPAVLAGPIAGVALDRLDRRRIMIASDLVRAAIALAFILTVSHPAPWLLYLLSGLLMFASPFFTAGRAAILPTITTPDELHTANSVTQTTQWATLTAGTLLAGLTAAKLGYVWAFALNSFSFLFSAAAISMLGGARGAFRSARKARLGTKVLRPWREYGEGLAYMRSTPLIFGIAMISVGWASGGGAAQILFTLFGEQVFHRGAAGIGTIWGFAGIGLLAGGALGHWIGSRVGFRGYKRAVAVSYVVHGATYVIFSQMHAYGLALLFIAISRVGMAVTTVLNFTQLLRHTRDEYRGRVFATLESVRWAVMMLSMAGAGVASQYYDPRSIGLVAGILSSLTAVWWTWADWTGRLSEPPRGPEEAAAPIDLAHDRPG